MAGMVTAVLSLSIAFLSRVGSLACLCVLPDPRDGMHGIPFCLWGSHLNQGLGCLVEIPDNNYYQLKGFMIGLLLTRRQFMSTMQHRRYAQHQNIFSLAQDGVEASACMIACASSDRPQSEQQVRYAAYPSSRS
mgnify:CR=1 FL=1